MLDYSTTTARYSIKRLEMRMNELFLEVESIKKALKMPDLSEKERKKVKSLEKRVKKSIKKLKKSTPPLKICSKPSTKTHR